MERLGYRPALNGVRGLAISAVVLYHTFGWPHGGYLGVDLFFVLSGFLITTLLLEEREANGRISLTSFYRRRALRLLPPLIPMVALLALDVYVGYRHGTVGHAAMVADFAKYAAGVFYVGNIVAAAGLTSVHGNHLWSLAQEEQFYVVWPAALLLAIGLRGRLELWCASAAALVVAYRCVLVFTGASFDRVYFAPDTRFDALLVGCALALLRARIPRAFLFRNATVLGGVGLAAWCALVVASPGSSHPTVTLLVVLTGAELAAALLILGVVDGHRRAVASLELRPLVSLGVISYGLYVWHPWLLFHAGRNIVGLAIALVGATLSYRYIERPFLRMKYRPAEQPDRPTLATEPLSVPAAHSWSFAQRHRQT